MKTIILMSMFLMVGCMGGSGGSGGSSDAGEPDPFQNDYDGCLDANGAQISCQDPATDLVIEYDSHGVYQNTGVSMDLMGTFDEDRRIVIPQFITIVQDTANSIQLNDVVKIKFANTLCSWTYTAPHFEFYSCVGTLTTAQHGDQIYLSDLADPANPQLDGKISFGVVRDPNSNHTGTIVLQANLGQ